VLFLNIVILHCHFERGGVTSVVENHVRALRDCDRVEQIVLVSGKRAGGLSSDTTSAVKRISAAHFDYDAENHTADSLPDRVSQIAQNLEQQLAGVGITRDNSVLHWHNHGLGKNSAAPATIRHLAESGWRILLQIHDFAEDNRPENYQRLIVASGATNKAEIDRYLYPVAPQIRYATLTQADAAVLTRLGIPTRQTDCLPNSVVPAAGGQTDKRESLAKIVKAMNLPEDASWCLYPVRGIRRKNVGEFLMLCRWLKPNQFGGLTLCPATPIERRSYERWRELAGEVAPKALFDAGQDPNVSFNDNISASEFIVSTSVAEGFGMAYLEPWLAHREVIARRLPTVTDDFEQSGVKLPKLYDGITIPGDKEWIRNCRAESSAAASAAWSGLPDEFRLSVGLDLSDNDDPIDFASLTPLRQIDVIRKLAADSGFESAVKQLSSDLVRYLADQADDQLVRHNAGVVNEQYSPQRTGSKLIAIYEELMVAPTDSQVESPHHAGVGVDLIAGVRPFFPCRTEVIDA
jgi:hypothetical protein